MYECVYTHDTDIARHVLLCMCVSIYVYIYIFLSFFFLVAQ